jgi:hypothetical protein
MKVYREVDVYIHVLLTWALVGGEWSASRSGRFTPGERVPGTHWIGGLDDMEKRKFVLLPELEIRPVSRPARSQSLYRLRYPGSCLLCGNVVSCNLSFCNTGLRIAIRTLRQTDWSNVRILGLHSIGALFEFSARTPAMLSQLSCSFPHPSRQILR